MEKKIDQSQRASKKKDSRLGVNSIVIPIALLLGRFLLFPEVHPTPLPSLEGYGFVLACFVISLFMAIVSLWQTKRAGKSIFENTAASLGAVLNVILCFLTILIYVDQYQDVVFRNNMNCSNNLRVLGEALFSYAEDNNGTFPPAENWCDLTIPYLDQKDYSDTYRIFRCDASKAFRGESSYAFNKNLSNRKVADIPTNIVMLFETDFGKHPCGRRGLLAERDSNDLSENGLSRLTVYKQRWNQTGGPELLTIDHHTGKGCNILFVGDRDTRFVRNVWSARDLRFVKNKELQNLTWTAGHQLADPSQ